MQCTNPQVMLLADYDVFRFLRSRAEGGSRASAKKSGRNPRKGSIENRVEHYFAQINSIACPWTDANVQLFMDRISKFDLMAGERLMLLNLRPHNTVGLIAVSYFLKLD